MCSAKFLLDKPRRCRYKKDVPQIMNVLNFNLCASGSQIGQSQIKADKKIHRID